MDLHDFDIVAEHYDLYVKKLLSENWHKNSVAFHLELAEKYGNNGILDIACGTGNIALPLVESGHTVYAFDISDAMVNRFRTKVEKLDPSLRSRVNVSVQNMISFSYQRNFSLVMIPASGFMHLTTPADQRKALLNINKHLNKGGVLTLNTFDPNVNLIADGSKGANTFRKRTEFETGDARRIEIYEAMSYDPENQKMEGVWQFVEYDRQHKKTKETDVPLKMRYTFRQEMKYLLELTGFEVLELYGSYNKNHAVYPSSLIWIARKID